MKKKILVGIIAFIIFMCCSCKSVLPTYDYFNYAIIALPNGEIVEGNIDSWCDFEGEQLQIKIGNTTYLTDTTRAVLIKR